MPGWLETVAIASFQNPRTGHVTEVIDPPLTAARELIANSLVHRDLSEWASSRAVELRMTGSKFTLSNPGGLYGISVERLGIHPLTSARNRRLIEICKHVRTEDGNVVEAIASGIPATVAALRDAGMPDPRSFDQGLMFTVTVDRTRTDEQPSPAPPKARLTSAERELMAVLTREMNVHELAEAIGATVNATQKRLASLREKGSVAMTGGSGRESTYTRLS